MSILADKHAIVSFSGYSKVILGYSKGIPGVSMSVLAVFLGIPTSKKCILGRGPPCLLYWNATLGISL